MRQLARQQKTAKNRNTARKIVEAPKFAFVKSVNRLASVVMRQLARQKTVKNRNTAQKIVEANEKSLKALIFRSSISQAKKR